MTAAVRTYICELIAHHESHLTDKHLPPIPDELRQDVEEGLKKGL